MPFISAVLRRHAAGLAAYEAKYGRAIPLTPGNRQRSDNTAVELHHLLPYSAEVFSDGATDAR